MVYPDSGDIDIGISSYKKKPVIPTLYLSGMLNKEARHNRVCMIWFHLYKILEKTKLICSNRKLIIC